MTTAHPDTPRLSAWAPLAVPTFRMLWLAQLGSNIGVWMQTVAAQWFLVEETHSSALVAWVQTASLLPVVLLSLVAGVLADAYDRRALLLLTTVLSTVVATVLTVLAFTDLLTPWLLLLMTFLIGCSTALTSPAWQAIQPELVPREQITAAASLGSVTVNGARAIGPAIGGALVALAGPGLVFGLNALSFVGVIVALLVWKRPSTTVRVREPLGPALRAGLRYVRAGPIVRRILLRSALFAFPASALWALLPVAAQEELGVNSSGYGLLLGLLGVGALVGVAVFPLVRARFSSSVVLAGSALVFGLGMVAVRWWPLAVVLPLLLFAGAAWIATLTTLNAAAQLSLAPWVRARGMSVYLLVFMGSQAVGSLLWGVLASLWGAGNVLVIGAGLLVLVAASVVVWPLRPQTGQLDRTIVAYCAPTPTLVFEPAPTDGPVVVVADYEVLAANVSAFIDAMRTVEKSRRRTGASAWRLDRSGETADQYREEFMVRSWSEYNRSHDERWTRSDQASYAVALALAVSVGSERHYFPVA